MKKIKIGQIGIGHNHGRAKMRTVQKFPELFEIVGDAEGNETWMDFGGKRRMGSDEIRENVRGRGKAYSHG